MRTLGMYAKRNYITLMMCAIALNREFLKSVNYALLGIEVSTYVFSHTEGTRS